MRDLKKEAPEMPNCTQKLYHFLTACGGNWRNTIYITCTSCPGNKTCADHLLAIDSEGKPVLMEIGRFCRLSGENIDPSECRGQLARQAFEDIFRNYLLWTLSVSGPCALWQLAPPDCPPNSNFQEVFCP
jgi:hypothetical protein